MESFIITIMNKGFGYFGVAFLIALENIFPPIPSEVILTLGGFMTSYTKMTVIGVIIFSTIGSIFGALILYYIGTLLSIRKLKRIVSSKPGRLLGLKEEDIDKTCSWFDNKGNKTVFFCRFIPVIRSLISIPAGITHMKIKPFIIFTLFGSLIWNSVLVILGRVLGSKWKLIVNFMNKYSSVCIILLCICATLFLSYKIYNRKKKK